MRAHQGPGRPQKRRRSQHNGRESGKLTRPRRLFHPRAYKISLPNVGKKSKGDRVEKLVVGSLVAKLRSRENLATYIAASQEERQRLIGDKAAKRIKLERDLEAAKREMSRVVEQIAKGIVEGEAVADEVRAIRERRKAIETELAEQPLLEKTVSFLPAAAQRFERAMSDLHEAFHAGGVTSITESASFIREILSSAALFRKEDGTGAVVEVKGYLNGLLTVDVDDERRNKFVMGVAGRALGSNPLRGCY